MQTKTKAQKNVTNAKRRRLERDAKKTIAQKNVTDAKRRRLERDAKKMKAQKNVADAKRRGQEQDAKKRKAQKNVTNAQRRGQEQDAKKRKIHKNVKDAKKQELPFQKDITVEQLLKLDDPFHSVGKDPMWTVLGHYYHSGAYRFHALRDVERNGQSKHDIEILKKEILSELLPPATLQNKQKCFVKTNGFADNHKTEYGRICACACCGMKDTMTFSTVAIASLEKLLSVPKDDPFINIIEDTTTIPIDRHGELFGSISVKDVLHWHYSRELRKWLYLHRNFIDCDKNGVESCMLCPTCFKQLCHDNKVPAFSLANVNFGNSNCVSVVGKQTLQGLEQLTELERMIISSGRLFHIILKLQENTDGMTTDRSRSALRGHFILFPLATDKFN